MYHYYCCHYLYYWFDGCKMLSSINLLLLIIRSMLVSWGVYFGVTVADETRVSVLCLWARAGVDWRYCVGWPCCCLWCLSKSWEDHFIIVCLPCLTLLSRREPLGKWGQTAVFAVCFVFFYLVAGLALSGLSFWPVKLHGKVCYVAPWYYSVWGLVMASVVQNKAAL